MHRRLSAAITAGLIGGIALAAPASAHVVSRYAEVDAYTLTAGRFWATSAALLGLAGVVVGAVALLRARRGRGNGARKGAVVAIAAAGIAVIGGVLNLAVADGGPGTGNGVVGGGAAVVLGLAAAVLGFLASRRAT